MDLYIHFPIHLYGVVLRYAQGQIHLYLLAIKYWAYNKVTFQVGQEKGIKCV
jgi:hypothetical protein